MREFLVVGVLVALTAICIAGCIPGDGKATREDPAGFFFGVWHGWIAPVSLIIGFFKYDIRLYETNNTGWWYDFGYYIAVISGFGGISLFRGRERKKNRRE